MDVRIPGGCSMNVEYTGRQYEITPAIRKEVESGLAKIRKILGDRFETKVILAVEKHRHKAEITISPVTVLFDRKNDLGFKSIEKHRHKAEITISPRNGPIV